MRTNERVRELRECRNLEFVFPQPIIPLFKPIGSPETLSRDSRAPPESIVLTRRCTTAATEPTMGVVSACLPSLRPLLKRLVSNTYHGPTFRSTRNKSAQEYGSGTSSRYMWSRNKGEDGDLRSFTRLEETGVKGNTPWGHKVHVHCGKKKHGSPDDQISLDEMQTPSRRIKVKTEVTLISTGELYFPTIH